MKSPGALRVRAGARRASRPPRLKTNPLTDDFTAHHRRRGGHAHRLVPLTSGEIFPCLFILVWPAFLGYGGDRPVSPTLHTPLMAGTNAIVGDLARRLTVAARRTLFPDQPSSSDGGRDRRSINVSAVF